MVSQLCTTQGRGLNSPPHWQIGLLEELGGRAGRWLEVLPVWTVLQRAKCRAGQG